MYHCCSHVVATALVVDVVAVDAMVVSTALVVVSRHCHSSRDRSCSLRCGSCCRRCRHDTDIVVATTLVVVVKSKKLPL
jgi:hypothetical protein